jgi:predicted CXXCH cytochrome family protein
MARSFSRPAAGGVIEDWERNNTFLHAPSQRHYEMIRRGDEFFLRRYQLDREGRPLNVLEQRIDWIIGSGDHSRGYLYGNEAGELFELPVAWYSQESRWGIAPGYDAPRHDGITRQITRECMFCHNAYPAAAPGADRPGQPHVFPRDLPQGTGCQRCHGPGAEHVRLADDADAPIELVRGSIVNPGRLAPDLRDDVCHQCHLQPTSRLTSFVRRFGRGDWSYRPGEPLADYLVHLDFREDRPRGARFEINHHPYRLRQSRCFVETRGALSCLSCHDPHRVVEEPRRAAHYRDACLSCHDRDDCGLEHAGAGEAPHPPGAAVAAPDDCVSCHMPARRTQDVVGVMMTDHLIARVPPADALAPLRETPPPRGAAPGLYSPGGAAPPPEEDLYQLLSAAADGDLHALDGLEQELLRAADAPADALIALGSSQLRAARFAGAAATFTRLLDADPGLAMAHANLGAALAGGGRHEDALRELLAAADLAPRDPVIRFDLAATYARLGRDEEAIEQGREALRLRPTYAKAWMNLGNALARTGRLPDAAAALGRAVVIDPNLVSASRSLGSALRDLGDWAEAMRVWRHAASLHREDAGVALELAEACLIAPQEPLRDPVESLQMAHRAATLQPDAARPLLALAAALLESGRHVEARDTALQAQRLGADRGTCLLVVALARHAAGVRGPALDAWHLARDAIAQRPPPDRLAIALLARAEEAFAGAEP